MTQKQILTTIESLPKNVQFAIANSVLDRLANEGPPPISDQLKSEFLRREEAFFTDPGKGQPWEQMREELFGE